MAYSTRMPLALLPLDDADPAGDLLSVLKTNEDKDRPSRRFEFRPKY